jgi:F1F0 ATPase subunit 2
MDWMVLLWSALAGVILGVLYFGGLWLTVQRLAGARHPALLAAASFLVRVLGLSGAVLLVTDGQIERLIALLVGFFLARQVLLLRLRPDKPGQRV